MAQNDNNIRLNAEFGFVADKTQVEAVKKAAKEAADAISGLSKSATGGATGFENVAAGAKQAATNLQGAASAADTFTQTQSKMQGAAGKSAEEVKKLGDQLDRVKKSSGNPNVPTFLQFSFLPAASLANTLGAPGVSRGLMAAGDIAGLQDAFVNIQSQIPKLRDRLSALGGIFGTLTDAGGKIAVALGATEGGVTAAFGGLLAVAAPLIITLGAFALVMNQIQQAAEAARKEGQAFAEGTFDIANAVAQGTTTREAQAGVDRQQQSLNSIEAERARFDAIARFRQNPQQYVVGLGRPTTVEAETPRLLQQLQELSHGNLTTFEAFDEYLTQLDAHIAELNSGVKSGQAAIDSYAFVPNDRAAAEARYNEINAIRDQARVNILLSDSTTLSVRQINQQTDSLVRQRATLTAVMSTLDNSSDAYKEYENQLAGIQGALEGLDALRPQNLAQAIERAKPALDKWMEGIKQVTSDFADETAKLQYQRNLTATREQEDFDIKRARQYRDYNQEIADLDDQLQERKKKKEKEELKRLNDLLKRLAELQQDFNESWFDAVAERDAKAAFLAKRQYEKDRQRLLDKQAEDNKAAAEEAADEEAANAKARAKRLRDFNQRLADEDADRALRLRRQQEDYMRQDYLRQQDSQRRIAQLTNALYQETNLNQYFLSALSNTLSNARNLWMQFVNQVAQPPPMQSYGTSQMLPGLYSQQPSPFSTYPGVLFAPNLPYANSLNYTYNTNVTAPNANPQVIAQTVNQALRAYVPRNIPTPY